MYTPASFKVDDKELIYDFIEKRIALLVFLLSSMEAVPTWNYVAVHITGKFTR